MRKLTTTVVTVANVLAALVFAVSALATGGVGVGSFVGAALAWLGVVLVARFR